MPTTPYLFFEGRAEEAIGFYAAALGAQTRMMMRFREAPDPPPPGMLPPGQEDRVMHAEIAIGEATLMVSDGGCSGAATFSGFAVSLPAADEAQARRWFDALAEGGVVRMPLGATFWSPAFGVVQDRFGVPWMIGV
jgi:PhnB protein